MFMLVNILIVIYSTYIYLELWNRVSKHFVIFLNFPCLIAWHMFTVLLAYVFFCRPCDSTSGNMNKTSVREKSRGVYLAIGWVFPSYSMLFRLC